MLVRDKDKRSPSPPKQQQLRRLLETVLKTDADFDAFCADHYNAVYRRFAAGMSRTQKTTLLLALVEDSQLLQWQLERQREEDAREAEAFHRNANTSDKRRLQRRQFLWVAGLGGLSAAGLAVGMGLRKRPVPTPPGPVRKPVRLQQLRLTPESVEQLRAAAQQVCEQGLKGPVARRHQAVLALGSTRDVRYTEVLTRTLKEDTDPLIQAQAAVALGKIGAASATALLKTLQTRVPPAVVAAVVEALYRLVESHEDLLQLQQTLHRGLLSPVNDVRVRSAYLLAPIDSQARELLWLQVEQRSTPHLTAIELRLLWRLHQSHHVQAERLLESELRSTNPVQRQQAAQVVPNEGWPPGISTSPLWQRAREILAQAALQEGADRLLAAATLAQLGLRPAESAVLDWLRETAASIGVSTQVRGQALTGIGGSGTDSDLSLLQEIFSAEQDLELKISAAAAALQIVCVLPSQLDEQAVARAIEEQRAGVSIGLFLSQPSLRALDYVLRMLEKTNDPQYAWLIGDMLRQLEQQQVDTRPLRTKLAQVRAALPKVEPSHKRITAVLTDSQDELTALLSDTDETTRVWSAERLIRRGTVPRAVVPALTSVQATPLSLRAYGLLQQLGVAGPPPHELVRQTLARASAADRRVVVQELGQWPLAEARPYLVRALADEDSGVRRRSLDALNAIIKNDPASTKEAVALSASSSGDLDSGVNFRRIQLMGYERPGSMRRYQPPKRIRLELPPPARTRVAFEGEKGVRFSVDGREFVVPIELDLTPGSYKLRWLDGNRDIKRPLLVPEQVRLRTVIPVPLARQRTMLL